MKKLIAIICLIFLMISCKKENNNAGPCYTCHLGGTVNGVTYNEDREYCGPEPIPPFTDALGNPITAFCTRRP